MLRPGGLVRSRAWAGDNVGVGESYFAWRSIDRVNKLHHSEPHCSDIAGCKADTAPAARQQVVVHRHRRTGQRVTSIFQAFPFF